MTHPLLQGLNTEQAKAVAHFTGPALVLAGAGSGKTKVLTHRIAYLINQGIHPRNILALTFTNKAAKEMEERICHLLNTTHLNGLRLNTFHSFGAYFLRQYYQYFGRNEGFTIYDTEDQLRLLKDVIARLNASAEKQQLSGILDKIQACKDVGKLPYELLNGYYQNEKMLDLQEIAIAYEQALKQANAFDFGDLILYLYLGLKSFPNLLNELQQRWQWVLVDEFQDTNVCQMSFLQYLCPKDGNLFVVGDDDQSIYAWRGADVSNMLDFHKHYPSCQTFKLEENYRSYGHILNAANAVISKNNKRHPKSLRTSKSKGNALVLYPAYNDKDEAKFVIQEIQKHRAQNISYHQMAILYRNNYLSVSFEDALKEAGIPYDVIKGFKFYDRAEIKDALSYLSLLINPNDDMAFRRAISMPSRGIGDANLKLVFDERMKFGGHLFDAIHRCLAKGLIKGKAALAFQEFYHLYTKGDYLNEEQMKDQAQSLLTQSGFLVAISKLDETEKENENRKLDNVMELLYRIGEYENQKIEKSESASWFDYLEQIKLINEVPNSENDANQKLSLSTIHSAKGLEFKIVFLVGLEDGIFPSSPERSDIAEERRLFYVALTRAKEHLYLSYAERRFRFNRVEEGVESRFIQDIPDESMMIEKRRYYGTPNTPPKFNTWHQSSSFQSSYPTTTPTPTPASRNRTYPSFARNTPPQNTTRVDTPKELTPMPRMNKQGTIYNRQFFEFGGVVEHEDLGRGILQTVENQGDKQVAVVQFSDGVQKILLTFLTAIESE